MTILCVCVNAAEIFAVLHPIGRVCFITKWMFVLFGGGVFMGIKIKECWLKLATAFLC